MVSSFACAQAGSVVTTHFHVAGTHRGGTVEVAYNLHRNRFETSLEVRAYGGDKNHEKILVSRGNTYLCAGDANAT